MSTDLVTRDGLQERSGGVWDYISPSRLNLWLRCPLAFKIRYLDGVETPTTPALFVGRMTHEALECWYRHRQLGITLPSAELNYRLKDLWAPAAAADSVVFESTAAEEACRTQTVDLVTAYLAQVPANEPRPLAVEAAVEAPLVDPATGEDLGIALLGVIDLVLDETDGPLIADFKTTSRGGEPLEITHEVQLSSYSFLFRHVSPVSEAAMEIRSLIKTKTPKIETYRYPARTDRHYRRLFALVREYLDALHAGRFVFRPGFGCGMCDFRDSHCRSWGG